MEEKEPRGETKGGGSTEGGEGTAEGSKEAKGAKGMRIRRREAREVIGGVEEYNRFTGEI